MPQIHYAVQVHDASSRESLPRYIGNDRTMISKKSLVSFLKSVRYAADCAPHSHHVVRLIYDRCTPDLVDYCHALPARFAASNIEIHITDLHPRMGIIDSIRECYQWMTDHGQDLVFQIQDDYLWSETAVAESIDIWYQNHENTGSHSLVQPYNNCWYWYRAQYVQHPLTVILGGRRYWIQCYDTSCTFLTSHQQFVRHWDLYEKFFHLIETDDSELEAKSLNHIMTQRGVLGVTPVNTLTFHLANRPDPYGDAHELWKSIDTDIVINDR